MKKFIVLDTVKVAGQVRKPGDILGEDLMPDSLIEQLLVADLIAGYVDDGGAADDDDHPTGNLDTANPPPPPPPPPAPPLTPPPKAKTKRAAGRKPKAT